MGQDILETIGVSGKPIAREPVFLDDDGEHVRISGNTVTGAKDGDADSYRAFYKRMTRYSDLLRTYCVLPAITTA